LPGKKDRNFSLAAWPSFWKLVDALEQWFDIHFVAVEGAVNATFPAKTNAA